MPIINRDHRPKATLSHLMLVAIVIILLLTITTPISHALEAAISDPALKSCLLEVATENNWTQAEQVTQLKCHSANVKSIKGIEHLPNLETLSLYNNKLIQLDADLTQFKRLNSLNLARNNIKQLKLESLPSVETIYLFDNGMENLELINLAELKVLKTNNNQLEHFSYANTPNLQKIYIFNNKLETINIYDLPKLQYMDCRQNPMPDELYDEMDRMDTATFLHDGNADDWQ
ncbi:MAG: hypothetical protein MI976_02145 [Pseudomonadales bacterium]|nr:hypothetical protein [Pseudomonadales bacterium]